MTVVLNFLSAQLDNITLLTTIYGCFILLLMMQAIVLVMCLRLILKSGAQSDIRAFLNEYWQWSHLHENNLMLSLWLSSFAAYFSTWIVTSMLSDISMLSAFKSAPILTLYVLISLIGLICYTAFNLKNQFESTKQTISHLKKMRIYNSFKSVLKKVQSAPISTTSWGGWVGTVASTTEWVAEHFVKRKINAEMKNALVNFSAYASIEYLFRMSVVAVAVCIISL